jgi:catechol 2,3-dioxygenase-like lactoylglutathione lyase family enzyme
MKQGEIAFMSTELRLVETTQVDDAVVDAALRFYEDVLGGRQIRAASGAEAAGELWFLVDGVVVRTGEHLRGSSARVSLGIEDADDAAARCWDAGFTVRVHPGMSEGPALTVVDPFGLEIALRGR